MPPPPPHIGDPRNSLQVGGVAQEEAAAFYGWGVHIYLVSKP